MEISQNGKEHGPVAPFRRLCVYCGSSSGTDAIYSQAATELGRALAELDIELVYGGSARGLMGCVADAVLQAGGRATGVIPERLVALEVAHRGLTNLHVVKSMHERKAIMTELADGFLVLPGAWGTLDELCEAATWAQLGIHNKPCGLWNVNGYWDSFIAFLQHSVAQGFLKQAHYQMLLVSTDLLQLLEMMNVRRAARETIPSKI
jgi:uncharacterized protein (TIGR00730 family)